MIIKLINLMEMFNDWHVEEKQFLIFQEIHNLCRQDYKNIEIIYNSSLKLKFSYTEEEKKKFEEFRSIRRKTINEREAFRETHSIQLKAQKKREIFTDAVEKILIQYFLQLYKTLNKNELKQVWNFNFTNHIKNRCEKEWIDFCASVCYFFPHIFKYNYPSNIIGIYKIMEYTNRKGELSTFSHSQVEKIIECFHKHNKSLDENKEIMEAIHIRENKVWLLKNMGWCKFEEKEENKYIATINLPKGDYMVEYPRSMRPNPIEYFHNFNGIHFQEITTNYGLKENIEHRVWLMEEIENGYDECFQILKDYLINDLLKIVKNYVE